MWCSEYFDSSGAPAGSPGSAIAPSSNPYGIFKTLRSDCEHEDKHSLLIKRYKKTFSRLADKWLADGTITAVQRNEIIAVVKSGSWKIWRPIMYIIPKDPILSAGRLISVPYGARAAYGPEMQILDLMPHEFDIIRNLS